MPTMISINAAAVLIVGTALLLRDATAASTAASRMSVQTFVHTFYGSNPSSDFCVPPSIYDTNSKDATDGTAARARAVEGITVDAAPISSIQPAGNLSAPRYPTVDVADVVMEPVNALFVNIAFETLLTIDDAFTAGMDPSVAERLMEYIAALRADTDDARTRFAAAMELALSSKDVEDIRVTLAEQYNVAGARRLQQAVADIGDIPPQNLDLEDVERTHWIQVATSDFLPAAMDCIFKDSTRDNKPNSKRVEFTTTDNNVTACACKAGHEGLTKADGLGTICAFIDMVAAGLTCGAFGQTYCPLGVPQFDAPGFDMCSMPLGTGSSSTDPNVDYDMWMAASSTVRDSKDLIFYEIPDAVQQKEGLTYYYGYRATREVMAFTTAALCGNETMHDLVPGWTTELLINNVHEGDELVDTLGRGSIPYGAVATRGCDAMIVLRGTYSAYEWALNFAFSQVDEYYTAKPSGHRMPQGKHHQGFAAVALSVQSTFEMFYEGLQQRCTSTSTGSPRILIVGHSLGAGVAVTLSHFLGARYSSTASVDGLFYAIPNAMDPTGATDLEGLVNLRAFYMTQDPIAELPCSTTQLPTGLPVCPNGNIISGPPGAFVKSRPFNGRVTITPQALVDVSGDARWTDDVLFGLGASVTTQEGKVNLNLSGKYWQSNTLQFDATHVCSYACFTGQFCRDPSTAQWSCGKVPRTPSDVQMFEPCHISGRSFDVNIALR